MDSDKNISASGGATAKSPVSGWSDTDLQSIMAQTVTRDTFVPTTTPSSTSIPSILSSPSVPSQSSTGHKSPPPGKIAGAVLGSVVALIVLLTISYMIFRSLRRKKANQSSIKPELPNELPNEHLSPPAEMSTDQPTQISELQGQNRIEMDGGWRGHEV